MEEFSSATTLRMIASISADVTSSDIVSTSCVHYSVVFVYSCSQSR